ncbi:MAG: hypothetical protein PF795_04860, partial [Kiritimatiellae bacterium]|nr:hypothetical protein [Kiritimatiellia bacterium]
METSVAKALNETDWEELIPKLVAFAHKHMCYLLADFDNMPVINGYDPKALTQEAIRRTIAGSREWEPNKVPLLDYLFGVIRSITDCEMGKHCSVNFVTPVKDNEGKLTDPTENVPDGGPTPQETTDTILISERQKIFLDSF